jgi:hypothetical protein
MSRDLETEEREWIADRAGKAESLLLLAVRRRKARLNTIAQADANNTIPVHLHPSHDALEKSLASISS